MTDSNGPFTTKVPKPTRSWCRPRGNHLTCARCGERKKMADFPVVKRDLVAYCTDCRIEAREEEKRKKREADIRRMKRCREDVVAAFGGGCECPGCDVREPAFLTVEHAFDRNDRTIYSARDAATTPYHLWELLVKKRFPVDRYRVLCHNCKMARQQEGGCPCGRLRG